MEQEVSIPSLTPLICWDLVNLDILLNTFDLSSFVDFKILDLFSAHDDKTYLGFHVLGFQRIQKQYFIDVIIYREI